MGDPRLDEPRRWGVFWIHHEAEELRVHHRATIPVDDARAVVVTLLEHGWLTALIVAAAIIVRVQAEAHLLQRPELAPVPESCAAECALHEALLRAGRALVDVGRLPAIVGGSDPVGRVPSAGDALLVAVTGRITSPGGSEGINSASVRWTAASSARAVVHAPTGMSVSTGWIAWPSHSPRSTERASSESGAGGGPPHFPNVYDGSSNTSFITVANSLKLSLQWPRKLDPCITATVFGFRLANPSKIRPVFGV